MRPSALVAFVSGLALCSTALAEPSDLPTLAVPPAKVAASVDPKAAAAVAAAIASEAQRFPVKPVAGADLAALAGDRASALPGCAEAACLAGLDADFVVASEVAEAPSSLVLSADLLLVRQAKSQMKATRQAPKSATLSELSQLAADAAAEILLAIGEPAAPRPAPQAAAPVPAPEQPQAQPAPAAAPASDKPAEAQALAAPAAPAPQPEAKAESATEPQPEAAPAAAVAAAPASTMSESDIHLGGYILDGAGAAMLLGGAISGIVAMTSWDAAKTAKAVKDYEDAVDRGRKSTVMADALYGMGGSVLAVGLILTLFPIAKPAAAPAPAPAQGTEPAPAQPAPVSVAPALLPGGAGLVVVGGF